MGRFKEIKIIETQEEAVNASSMYILSISEDNFRIIITDDEGNKKISAAVTGTSEFIQLEDAPLTYSNNAGKVVSVNDTEDGLVFTDISSTGGQLEYNNDFDII